METGAMFVRLTTENDIKYVNIQHIRTIERLHYEPEESIYAGGWRLQFGTGGNYNSFDSLEITAHQFQQLVEFLPIANRA